MKAAMLEILLLVFPFILYHSIILCWFIFGAHYALFQSSFSEAAVPGGQKRPPMDMAELG